MVSVRVTQAMDKLTCSRTRPPAIANAKTSGARVKTIDQLVLSKSANVLSLAFMYRVTNRAAAKEEAACPLGKLCMLLLLELPHRKVQLNVCVRGRHTHTLSQLHLFLCNS
jgi:hypothetical protein